ncbi:L-lactate permease [Nocardiopsis sediminis]|uniref:L-lactate permease n=1 Tax=Nocardiopsis sediminis TaxID=1778267 RepID=A0ABV8FSQ7_9ACTN
MPPAPLAAYRPQLDPVADSLAWSALVATLPLLVLFLLLGVLRLRAQWAGLGALACAIVVAVAAYGMPVSQAALAATEGAAFGLFPIMWIVVNAIWIYTMTVATGHFTTLRRSVSSISPDLRIQAMIIAFCFGGLLEALAGFGTPVAITAVMLIGLGFRPMKAAVVTLVANTAPVAFGALATPIITLSNITALPLQELSAVVGRQTPVLACFVPLVLVYIVDGRRGLRQTWLPAVVVGVAFAVGQFAAANYMSVQLTDIVAAFAGTGAAVLLLRYWSPAMVLTGERAAQEAPEEPAPAAPSGRGSAAAPSTGTGPAGGTDAGTPAGPAVPADDGPLRRGDVLLAYAPYAVIIAVFSIAQFGPLRDLLAATTVVVPWPGLDVLSLSGEPATAATFRFDWLASGGTLLLLAGLVSAAILRLRPAAVLRAYADTLRQLAAPIVTVAAVLALAYVMNLSGQTITIGHWIAGAGTLFAFFSPILGWIGVAVTGSDTSANALFGTLQVAAADNIGLDPVLMAAANSSGGVLGKMISPQNLAIAAAATGLAGREGDLFRRVFGWGLVMLLGMCVLVYLQSTGVLGWMLP